MSAVIEHEAPGPWTEDAACKNVDPDLFFPGGPDTGHAAAHDAGRAKAVCAVCPVTEDCLDYALRNHEQHGVWGGTTPRERRAMRWRR